MANKPKPDFSINEPQREWQSEAEFQACCNKWFCSSYPDQIGQLFMVYNNPPNAIIGSKLITMGMHRGASDFIYIPSRRQVHWIELKIGYNTQSDNQIRFEQMVRRLGFDYHLIKSKWYEDLTTFTNLIKFLNQ